MGIAKVPTMIRQEQIAEVALDLVAREGLKALSVARIAREVGIVPSAIYRHFKGKEAVLDTLIELIGRKLQENVQAARAETDDPVEQLQRLLMRHAALVHENRGIPRIVFAEDVYSGHPGRRDRMYAIVERYLAQVSAILAEGQKKRRIRREIEPSTVATVFLGMVQTPAVLWHLSGGAFDITGQVQEAWQMMQKVIAA